MSTLDSFDEDVTKLSVEGVFAIAYDCAIRMEREGGKLSFSSSASAFAFDLYGLESQNVRMVR